MKVLSMFDGMSCGQIALKRLGIPVKTYYASEIDKYAIEVCKNNFPNTIHVGDITKLDPKDFMDVDLMLAGSPCQGFSFAGKQLAFDDPRSALFFEFIRLLKAIKPKYFLLENVMMQREFLDVITQQVSDIYPEHKEPGELFGGIIKPILLNSSLVSAQSRQRYYWTNIKGIREPKDMGIVLKDILEDNQEFGEAPNYLNGMFGDQRRGDMVSDENEKASCLTASMYKGQVSTFVKRSNKPNQVNPSKKASGEQPHMQDRVFDEDGKSHALTAAFAARTNVATKPKQIGVAVDIKGHDQIKRVYSPDGKSPTLTTMTGGHRQPKIIKGAAIRGRYTEDGIQQMLELRSDDKANSITTVQTDSIIHNGNLQYRKLTPLECERLQTVPDNYTQSVSNTQRYKMLGNGWTVDMICHILSYMQLGEE